MDEHLFRADELAQAAPHRPPPSREWLTQQCARLDLSETARKLIVAAGTRSERRGNWLVYAGSAKDLVEDVGVTDRQIRRDVRPECIEFGVLHYISDRSRKGSQWMIDMGILIEGIPAPQTPAIVRRPAPIERQQELFVKPPAVSPPVLSDVPTRPHRVLTCPDRSSPNVRTGMAAVLHVLTYVLTGWKRRPDGSSQVLTPSVPMSSPGPHQVPTCPDTSSMEVLTCPDPGPDMSPPGPHRVLTPPCNASPSPPSLSYLSKTPPPSESNADGTLKVLIWGRSLKPAELQDPEALLDLFEILVLEGFAVPSEQDELAFFALVVNVQRQPKIQDKIGFLTKTIDGRCKDKFGRDWRSRPTHSDVEAARMALRQLNHGDEVAPVRDRYLANLQEAAHEAQAKAAWKAKQMAMAQQLERDDIRARQEGVS